MSQINSHILIVEDDAVVRETLKIVLENKGYKITECENGYQAIELIKKNVPDILLIDYNLPDINGIEVIKQSLLISKQIISIVISGYRSLEVAIEGMRLGAKAYLIKPIIPEELIKIIEKNLMERDRFDQDKDHRVKILQQLKIDEDKDFIEIVNNQSILHNKSSIFQKILFFKKSERGKK